MKLGDQYHRQCNEERPHCHVLALSIKELTQPRGGGGGSGRAVPRCRHIGCVVSHGAAAMSCCVRVIGTCVTCAGCATMTRRGGGGDHWKVCRGTCRDMGKLLSN